MLHVNNMLTLNVNMLTLNNMLHVTCKLYMLHLDGEQNVEVYYAGKKYIKIKYENIFDSGLFRTEI